MSSSSTASAVSLRYPWMFGRTHDLFFFFFSALIGLSVFALTQSSLVATSIVFAVLIPTAFGAGPFHQGPTWFMYLDRNNRTHYCSTLQKKLIFYVAPPAILLLSTLGMIYCKPVIIAIWFVWSIQHLVQQNVGILLLYHNPRDNEAVVPRKIETLTLQVPAVFFTLLFFRRTSMPGGNIFFDGLIAGFGIWCVILLFAYAGELRKQLAEGKALNVPALGFWALSAFCLFPFGCMGRDFSEAFLAPVTWHWFQYIGLNWRLVRKKYSGQDQIEQLPMARPITLFFATCLTLVAVNLSLSMSTHTPGLPAFSKDAIIGVLVGFVNIHYFLDAFMWRFREPYQRAAILPYLISRPGAPSSPATAGTLVAASVSAPGATTSAASSAQTAGQLPIESAASSALPNSTTGSIPTDVQPA